MLGLFIQQSKQIFSLLGVTKYLELGPIFLTSMHIIFIGFIDRTFETKGEAIIHQRHEIYVVSALKNICPQNGLLSTAFLAGLLVLFYTFIRFEKFVAPTAEDSTSAGHDIMTNDSALIIHRYHRYYEVSTVIIEVAPTEKKKDQLW